jgi:hypothetical protein
MEDHTLYAEFRRAIDCFECMPASPRTLARAMGSTLKAVGRCFHDVDR